MKKNRVRLTEAQLHKVIRESVKKVLSELDWRTYHNAKQKAYARGDNELAGRFDNAARERMFNRTPSGQYNKGAKELQNIENAKKKGDAYDMSTFHKQFQQDTEDLNNDWRNHVTGKSQYVKGKGWQ